MFKTVLILFSLLNPSVFAKSTDDSGIHKHKAGIDDVISDVGLFKRRRNKPEDNVVHTEVETEVEKSSPGIHQERNKNRGGRLVKRRRNKPEDSVTHTENETEHNRRGRNKNFRQKDKKSKSTSITATPTATSVTPTSVTPTSVTATSVTATSVTATQTV